MDNLAFLELVPASINSWAPRATSVVCRRSSTCDNLFSRSNSLLSVLIFYGPSLPLMRGILTIHSMVLPSRSAAFPLWTWHMHYYSAVFAWLCAVTCVWINLIPEMLVVALSTYILLSSTDTEKKRWSTSCSVFVAELSNRVS
jgi:hypothetical protein